MSEPFDRFLKIFPQRRESFDVERTREAWGRAIKRALPTTIIAAAAEYQRAREGKPTRYTLTARRWLDESRWRDLSPSRPGVRTLIWIHYGSAEWWLWSAFYRATRGKSPPMDRRGGWRFPARSPPPLPKQQNDFQSERMQR